MVGGELKEMTLQEVRFYMGRFTTEEETNYNNKVESMLEDMQ